MSQRNRKGLLQPSGRRLRPRGNWEGSCTRSQEERRAKERSSEAAAAG